MADIYSYWGKAAADDEFHRLVYHCLDVAAVAKILLRRDERLVQSLSRTSGLTTESLRNSLPPLIALHDIGKFADTFQGLRAGVRNALGQPEVTRAYTERHDMLGLHLWKSSAVKNVAFPEGEGLDQFEIEEAALAWMRSITGHHGAPPVRRNVSLNPLDPRLIGTEATRAAVAFTEAVMELFGRPRWAASHNEWSLESMARASWLVAGFTVVCDWLGSDTIYFPYEERVVPLHEYFERALLQAEEAVTASRLLPPKTAAEKPIKELFPFVETASPLQELASNLELGSGPQLVVIEEVTGAGKTEAALILAHRLMAAGSADGLYIALPTMATANAMYRRVDAVYRQLFTSDSNPQLVLAHGMARRVLKGNGAYDGSGQGAEWSASEERASWLDDHRKAALLAPVGVGTIDQALLGALKARHNSLRLLGLHRHVLVVDEVHACDTYMNGVLERLLEAQAALGGSAILLSATLPLSGRKSLAEAFQNGLLGRPKRRSVLSAPVASSKRPGPASVAYPLLTRLDRENCDEHPVDIQPRTSRRVDVRFVESVESSVGVLAAAAQSGQCAVWIRNTVGDALLAFDILRDRLGAERVTLFHARFTMMDRLAIEKRIVERFGKNGIPQDRAGHVVVATQVVEQSLDLDFDCMVSDLAPIDLLLQRAGRLHRHVRPNRGSPLLHILAPPWTESPGKNWPGAELGGTRFVYPELSLLWFTQRTLRRLGCLETPVQSRELIESVFAAHDVPSSLERNVIDQDGREKADASMASFNTINFDYGYDSDANDWRSDTIVPTRLADEPSHLLRLALVNDGKVLPLSGEYWTDSSVSVRMRVVKERKIDRWEPLIIALEKELPKNGQGAVTIPGDLVDGVWNAKAVDAAEKPVLLTYTSNRGLQISKAGN